MAKEPIHALVYGDPGSRKSTFCATMPKPMYVAFTEPFGKDTPYLRRGEPGELYEEDGVQCRDVFSKKHPDRVIIHLEYFHDKGYGTLTNVELVGDAGRKRDVRDPSEGPTAYPKMLSRFARFKSSEWATKLGFLMSLRTTPTGLIVISVILSSL